MVFLLKENLTYDGLKGFKDEVTLFRSLLQEVYDGKHGMRWRSDLMKILNPFACHCALLVLQKEH